MKKFIVTLVTVFVSIHAFAFDLMAPKGWDESQIGAVQIYTQLEYNTVNDVNGNLNLIPIQYPTGFSINEITEIMNENTARLSKYHDYRLLDKTSTTTLQSCSFVGTTLYIKEYYIKEYDTLNVVTVTAGSVEEINRISKLFNL